MLPPVLVRETAVPQAIVETDGFRAAVYVSGRFVSSTSATTDTGYDAVAASSYAFYTWSIDGIAWNFVEEPLLTGMSHGLVMLENGVMVRAAGTGGVFAHSTDGVNWTRSAPVYGAVSTYIVYTGGVYMMRNNTVSIASTDLVNWLRGTVPGFSSGYVYTHTANGRFFLVGVSGVADDKIWTSTDGVNWTQSAMPASGGNTWGIMNIAYGAGKYVTASYGATNLFARSTDGVNWTSFTGAANSYGNAIRFIDSTFFVIHGTWNSISTSTDGVAWSTRFLDAVSREFSPVIKVGSNFCTGSRGKTYTSPDGVTWTAHNVSANATSRVPGHSTAFTYASTVLAYSTDFITFTPVTATVAVFLVPTGELDGEQYCIHSKKVAGYDQNYVFTTPDQGDSWVQRGTISGIATYDIAYGAGIYVAVGRPEGVFSSTSYATSTDFITWTLRSNMPSTTYGMERVTHTGVRFVAVPQVETVCATSLDGLSWTAGTLPTNYIYSMTSFNGYAFICANGVIYRSSNGTSWTQYGYGEQCGTVSPDGYLYAHMSLTNTASSFWFYRTSDGVTPEKYNEDDPGYSYGGSYAFYFPENGPVALISNIYNATVTVIEFVENMFGARASKKHYSVPGLTDYYRVSRPTRVMPDGSFRVEKYNPAPPNNTIVFLYYKLDVRTEDYTEASPFETSQGLYYQQWPSLSLGAGLFAMYMALDSNDESYVSVSSDGLDWSAPVHAPSFGWYGAYIVGNPPDLIWVIEGTRELLLSRDGASWDPVQLSIAPVDAYFDSLAYVSGEYLTVNWGTAELYRSPDARAWAMDTLPLAAEWNTIVVAEGFVIIFPYHYSVTNQYLRSVDTRTWTIHSLPSARDQFSTYAAGNGLLIFTDANGAVPGWLWITSDGVNWVYRSMGVAAFQVRIIDFSGGFFYVPVYSDYGQVEFPVLYRSADGVQWEAVSDMPKNPNNSIARGRRVLYQPPGSTPYVANYVAGLFWDGKQRCVEQ